MSIVNSSGERVAPGDREPSAGDSGDGTASNAIAGESRHDVRSEPAAVRDAAAMPDAVTQAQALLDSWRERGAERIAPMRFRFIDALHRRAAAHSGETRRLLDEKLTQALDEYSAELARAGFATADAAQDRAASQQRASQQREPVRGALSELIEYVARGAQPNADNRIGRAGKDRSRDAAQPAPLRPDLSSWPEMDLLDYFRATWSRLSAERQLRQSEDRVPRNAGPLNSSSLVHRSLSLMRELSPGYLQHFLSYVDALSWVEQMNGAAGAPKDAPRAANTATGKKGERSRAR